MVTYTLLRGHGPLRKNRVFQILQLLVHIRFHSSPQAVVNNLFNPHNLTKSLRFLFDFIGQSFCNIITIIPNLRASFINIYIMMIIINHFIINIIISRTTNHFADIFNYLILIILIMMMMIIIIIYRQN
ncbi:hypothetical protein Hanom_Chr01g00036071 [Helianthus anomalus]